MLRPGIAELQRAVEKTPPDRRNEAQTDLRFARAAGIHFQSVANQARFVLARDALAKPSGTPSPEERHRLQAPAEAGFQPTLQLVQRGGDPRRNHPRNIPAEN